MAPLILKRASAGKRCYTIPGAWETIGQNTIFCSNREPKTWKKPTKMFPAEDSARPKNSLRVGPRAVSLPASFQTF
jgi:hypothetical protein